MFGLLFGYLPYNQIIINDYNTPTSCVVVEKATDRRFGSDRFGKVDNTTQEIICY